VSTDEPHIDCLTTGRNTPGFTLSAASIGHPAVDVLAQGKNFVIRGVTSRGIFVSVDEKTIIFLSRERFKGPLIVNLPWEPVVLDQIAIKADGKVCPRGFRFSYPDLFIDVSSAETWSALSQWNPIPPPGSTPNHSQISSFLNLLQSRVPTPNELVAAALQAINPAALPRPDEGGETAKYINLAYLAVKTYDLAALQPVVFYLAGRGRGLTPSGDDFLLGLVYGLFMFPYRFQAIREDASAMIVATVKKRSTLISANLVECAAAGEIDERLGAAFQALLHPDYPPEAAMRGILGWGSSSGMDATAGMAVIMAAERKLND